MANLRFLRGAGAPLRALRGVGGQLRSFQDASGARKLLLSLGSVSFLAGLTLLGFGVITAFSGGDGRAEGPPVVQVTATSSATPRPTMTPKRVTPTPVPTPVPLPPLGDSEYRMVISKIGVDAPVQTFGLDEDSVPVVPTGANAGQIVAWYNFSAKPGTGSNAVFAGHVTWNGVAVFYNLTSMEVGDGIELKGQDGTTLDYTVTKVFSVDPSTDPHATDVMLPSSNDMITVITCDGTFVNTGDPVFGGEYDHRLVIQADLSSVTPAAENAPAGAG